MVDADLSIVQFSPSLLFGGFFISLAGLKSCPLTALRLDILGSALGLGVQLPLTFFVKLTSIQLGTDVFSYYNQPGLGRWRPTPVSVLLGAPRNLRLIATH